MKDSLETIRRKMDRAAELATVVRTMKAMAASSITQYERSVEALENYYRTVELALAAVYRQKNLRSTLQPPRGKQTSGSGILIFGSDMGLVGQFNQVLYEFFSTHTGDRNEKKTVWVVGERMYGLLEREGWHPEGLSPVPNSVAGITGLTGRLLQQLEKWLSADRFTELTLFYNRPLSGARYEPVQVALIPPNQTWQKELIALPWPGPSLPEILELPEKALGEFLQEYFFVSVFRASAESLASENASRLAAMQRAEKNIRERMEDLHLAYHQLRQQSIDEELFDVVYGSEALSEDLKKKQAGSGDAGR